MVKIGIIGSNFGKVGLVPAFISIKGCRVIPIGEEEDWRVFLENEKLDAVALAVPPNVQYQIAKTAIKNGLHVFAEKPLAVNLNQAKELSALAKKYKVVTSVDFMFPEISEWQKVKELLDRKTFGKLQSISVNWNWLSGDIKYKRSSWKTSLGEGGGVLSFYFSHGLYYLEAFAGKIEKVKTKFTYSKESKNGAEVGIDLLLKFKNGVAGDVHVFCNNREMVKHHLKFECEEGEIVLENENAIVNNFVITTHSKNHTKIIKVKKDKDKKGEDERVKIVRILAKRFIDSCISKRQMSPSFKDGLRVQKLIEITRKGKI